MYMTSTQPTAEEFGGKEATMAHSIVSIEAFDASEKGALSGHAAVCSCGEHIRTSLSGMIAQVEGEKHVAYMNKKEGR